MPIPRRYPQSCKKWHAGNLQRLSARHAHDRAETINADLLAHQG
jgi:hypothetical protein